MKKIFFLTLPVLTSAWPALAAEDGGMGNGAYFALAAGFAIGVAAFGCGMGQGRVGASAMEGLARNPQAKDAMFVPMIIGLALIESIAIYALVVAILLYTKI